MEKLDTDLEETATIEKSKVLLNREWSFWENYEPKEQKEQKESDYSKQLKEIYTFNDIISFWQFWNHYPGNDIKKIFFDGEYLHYFFKEKYRIIAMNVFVKGIKPMWEDEKNKGGKYLQFEYQIKKIESEDFCRVSSTSWKKLILNTMGENYPGCENVNGIRFVDKTHFERGKIVLFRIEIWVNKFLSDDLLNQLKEFMMKQMGCEVIEVKDIK